MTGLGSAAFGFLAATAIAAALGTAGGPLASAVDAILCRRQTEPDAARSRRVVVATAGAVVAAAGLAACVQTAGFLMIATLALVLAASGLFPALVGALWWRRASASGVTAAIVAGAGSAVLYMAAVRFFPVPFYEAFQGLSNAGDMGVEAFAELKDAWLAATPGPAQDAAWATLAAQTEAMANWWGIKPMAVALIGMPAGIAALVIFSVLIPDRAKTL
jgi:cation/acetate symporter